MSEEQKKHRSVQEIQGEYQNMCARAGHLWYSTQCHKDDLNLVKEQLKELNLEAAASHAASAKEQPKQEEPKKEEEQNAQS